MLRWIFLIVLLLNAVLYGWFYQEQENRRRVAERADARVHGVADLDLIDEVPASALRARQMSLPQPETDLVVPAQNARYCFRLGPFSDSQGLDRWLSDAVLGAVELQQVERVGQQSAAEDEVAYRVMVSAPEVLASRDQLMAEMQQLGLAGEWVGTGTGPGALMVAEYSRQDQAQALLQALTGQGYAAVLEQQAAERYQYYLLLRTDTDVIASTTWLTSLLQNFPLVKSEKKLCQGLATTTGRE
ncbi:MAG: hypothetical protein V7707_06665 [Motiliproteus sp.]